MERTKGRPFEVCCKDVVHSNKVTVRDMLSGEEFKAPALGWEWVNSWYADVTFLFRGQEFTVRAEVDSDIPDF
jgi:hypothetical protein